MKKSFAKYLGDSLLIIFSVLFALLINSSYENYALRKKKKVALTGITNELHRNKAIVTQWIEDHTKIRDAIAKASVNPQDSMYLDLGKYDFFNFGLVNDNRPIVEAFLTNTAWETTRQSGILSEIDFGVAQKIAHAYEMQELLGDKTLHDLVDYYYSPEVHDITNLRKTLQLFMLRFYDMTTKEETLVKLYDLALEHLEERK